MVDEGTRREVWNGKIPVCFIVDQEEVGTTNIPPELVFMLLPRVSYFPFIYDKLENVYGGIVGKSIEEMIWLSFGSTPLKWHYPVGVLYDIHGRSSTLPWEVIVHFKNYPVDQLLLYESKALETHFKSKMKEADWLKHKAEVVQQMTPQEFSRLWQGFSQGSYDEFWSVNQKMMLNSRGDIEIFKHIPFCIYKEGNKVYQRLIPGAGSTIGDLLQMYVKDEHVDSKYQALVQGVELPVDTPLQWLSTYMCNPDNFIHVCIVCNT